MIIKNEHMFDYDKRVKIFNENVKYFMKNDILTFLHTQEKESIITKIKTKHYNVGIFGLEYSVNYYELNNSNNYNHNTFTLFHTLIKLKRNDKIIKFYKE